MGMNKRLSKYGDNNIVSFREFLEDDFFLFCDGHPDKMQTMVYMEDIKEPVPPSNKQMGVLLARLDIIWKDFCKRMQLHGKIEHTFISNVKERWHEKGEEQKRVKAFINHGNSEVI